MATTNFDLPVNNVTGTVFRNNVLSITEALASTHRSNGDLPVTYPGMLQVYDTGSTDTLRVRNSADDDWVTLMPDLSTQYGGLASVISGASLLGADNVFTGRNDFQGELEVSGPADFNGTFNVDGAATFTGSVAFSSVPAGLATQASLNALASSLSGALRRRNSYSRTPNLGTDDTFAHGLGVVPALVVVRLKFRQNFEGYDSGHVIEFPPSVTPEVVTGSTIPQSGISVRVDATNIQTVLSDRLYVVSRSSQDVVAITSGAVFELQYVLYTD